MLTVKLKQEGLPLKNARASDLAGAARLVTDWQDGRGLGASDLGRGHGEVLRDGRLVARVSFNGTVTAADPR